jgi:hypothetical protein
MPLPERGQITIGSVTLSTDPETYEPLNWEKRYSVHPALAGTDGTKAVTIQDFGMYAKDNTLRLSSGTGQWLDQAHVENLHDLFRERAGVHRFTDWLGNEMDVFITRFRPIPEVTMPDIDANGLTLGNLWRYELECRVVTLFSLHGNGYGGL